MRFEKRAPLAKRWLGEDLRFGKRRHDVTGFAPFRFSKKEDSHIGFKEIRPASNAGYIGISYPLEQDVGQGDIDQSLSEPYLRFGKRRQDVTGFAPIRFDKEEDSHIRFKEIRPAPNTGYIGISYPLGPDVGQGDIDQSLIEPYPFDWGVGLKRILSRLDRDYEEFLQNLIRMSPNQELHERFRVAFGQAWLKK